MPSSSTVLFGQKRKPIRSPIITCWTPKRTPEPLAHRPSHFALRLSHLSRHPSHDSQNSHSISAHSHYHPALAGCSPNLNPVELFQQFPSPFYTATIHRPRRGRVPLCREGDRYFPPLTSHLRLSHLRIS